LKEKYSNFINIYFLSFDTIFSIVTGIILLMATKEWLDFKEFIIPIYNVMVSVMGIITAGIFMVFSVFISIASDDFVLFLENNNKKYTQILNIFRSVLKIVIAVLIIDICMIVFSYIAVDYEYVLQSKYIFAVYIVINTYSLLSTYSAINALIEYSKKRIEFIKQK